MPVLDPDAQLLSEIEEFLRESGMSATTFGNKALKDPGFVFDMREPGEKSRSPSGRTASKIREFMAAQRREALKRSGSHDGRATTAA